MNKVLIALALATITGCSGAPNEEGSSSQPLNGGSKDSGNDGDSGCDVQLVEVADALTNSPPPGETAALVDEYDALVEVCGAEGVTGGDDGSGSDAGTADDTGCDIKLTAVTGALTESPTPDEAAELLELYDAIVEVCGDEGVTGDSDDSDDGPTLTPTPGEPGTEPVPTE